MAPDDSSINQKVLMPKTSSEVYEGIQNFCSVFYDGYMGFIPNECFADKRMLVWKCIFLGLNDSNFSEQVQ